MYLIELMPLIANITATKSELIICCLICQVAIIAGVRHFNSRVQSYAPWIMLYIVCMTYFINTDYYSYLEDYNDGFRLVGAKEPFYIWLHSISFGHYTIWRTFVWGSAIIIFYKLCSRLNINKNIAIFILIMFATSKFAYGRVILAMATYYLGLSYISKPIDSKFMSFLIAIILIPSSYFFHRSMLVIIALTPLAFVNFNKKKLILLLLISPLLVSGIKLIFNLFVSGSVQMDNELASFQSSAERTSSMDDSYQARNWKSRIMYNVGLFSIFIPYIYITYATCLKKKMLLIELPNKLKPFFNITTIIVYFSTIVLYWVRVGNSSIIGMRYLFMSLIPLIILMAYMYQSSFISKKTLYKLMFLGFVSFEFNVVIYTFLNV